MGMGVERHAPAALPPGKTRYPLYRRLGGAQGRSGRVRKISPPTVIRSPDHPALSKSVYRLSCAGPLTFMCFCIYFHTPALVLADFSILITCYFLDNKVQGFTVRLLLIKPVKKLIVVVFILRAKIRNVGIE